MNAVVLGGGQNDPLAKSYGVQSKALIEIHNEPMSAFVLRALRANVERIVYVGPVTTALDGLYDLNVPDCGSMLENLEAGLEALHSSERVLVATADMPLLTTESVRDLLTQDPGAGLVYPIIPKATAEARFPGGKRTYARLREGQFTGGNIFLLEPQLIKNFMPKLKQVIANRKNPFVLAGFIGGSVLVKFALGLVTIQELEARIGCILNVTAKALVMNRAEIGFDVDKFEDLKAVMYELDVLFENSVQDKIIKNAT